MVGRRLLCWFFPGWCSCAANGWSEEIQTICGAWRQVSAVRFIWGGATMTTVRGRKEGTAAAAGADGLVARAEESGRRRARGPARGGLRFVFYGRVSTED